MNTCLLFFLLLFSIRLFAQENVSEAELIKKIGSSSDTARINALVELGAAYLFKGKTDSALRYEEEALQSSEKIGYQKGTADACNSLGNYNLIHGNNAEALQYYLRSLQIREKLGLRKDMIPSYINISTVHLRQKQYPESMQYLEKAWTIAREDKDSVRLAGIYNNYATILANSGNMDSALFYLKSGANIGTLIENRSDIDKKQLGHYKKNALLGIAQILSRKGEGAKIRPLLDSLWQNEPVETGAPNKIAILKILSEFSLRDSNYHQAITYANLALGIDSGYRNPILATDLYSLLADSYAALKDYRNAYEATYLYNQFKDSVFSRNRFATINEMQARYETEKKDLAIQKLRSEKKTQFILILAALGAVLITLALLALAWRARKLQRKLFIQQEQAQAREREIEKNALEKRTTELEQMALRAQMNPHFIFNCLNSVQHFVMKQDIDGVNRYLDSFARLIRQTLDNSSQPLISLEQEKRYLDTYLSLEQTKSNHAFSYEIITGPGIDTHSVFIPGMILQPFAENSVQHGITGLHDRKGQVRISFSMNGSLTCTIEDNGVGKDAAMKRKRLQAEGHEPKGISLTYKRVEAINKMYGANILITENEVKDADGSIKGMRVNVEFPIDLA